MQTRPLGGTGITVSALTFGCGAVGGLMVRGDPETQREAVARALDGGIRLFDTAAFYGDGLSETALGRALPRGEARAAVATKVRLRPEDLAGGVAAAIRASLDASLRRLGRESVDLFQLHNRVGPEDAGDALGVERILGDVIPAFEALRRAGKVRALGFTALGDAAAIERLAAAGVFASAQVPFNLLNPSAAGDGQGQGRGESARLLRPGTSLGTIGIRILAGGALGGAETRHALAAPVVAPVGGGPGTARDYPADLRAAARFQTLVAAGAARSPAALAIRYGLAAPLDTVAVGFSSLDQLDAALEAAADGPLAADVLAEIGRIQADPA
ncbi:aldo/keto reductase [Methylobacterium sp. NEAU 140]|uniref:aldo/keto reductase n=1 Tax=Methylobacterium sp. NEAU 140 TaxID=3064945 RepID=UPI002736E4E4|nr:aldo/keto reductase [Methylobacterium sp. NEAU 140]MDP4023372.1 aldo/keto reductase [Methylobacterium sp. NEAU 140]